MRVRPITIFFIAAVIIIVIVSTVPWQSASESTTVTIGYFHGGRVNMIYRTHINGFFDQEEVEVKLYTKNLGGNELLEVPKIHEEFLEMSESTLKLGRMRGTEIVDMIINRDVVAGTIGESSFIQKINEGAPIVAVALLGYTAVPGKAIIMRKDVKINSTEDFKDKTLISKRGGPGDAIFLREFIEDIGLTPGDLNIIDQVDEDQVTEWLEEGKIDGGLFHVKGVRNLVLNDVAYIYRPMNWMNIEISHSVLVFHKDFIEEHPEEVEKVVMAYVRRIKYEKNIPEEEKDRSWAKGLMMVGEFQGMSIPTYDFPPKIRINLLNEMQDLLLKYGYIEEKINIEEFVDNSYVEKAHTELNIA